MDLHADFTALASRAGVCLDVQPVLDAYSESHRRYHTVQHLRAVLEALDALQSTARAAAARAGAGLDVDAVRWAAYYHDIVYRTDAGGSEEDSARRLEADLPACGLRGEAARLIRMTADHVYAPDDIAAAWLSDADLLVLAGPDYPGYVERVRAEFAHVPEELWVQGRSGVLEGLLDGVRLFGLAGDDVEAAARANLHAELAELQGR